MTAPNSPPPSSHAALIIDPDPVWRQNAAQGVRSAAGVTEADSWDSAMQSLQTSPVNILVVGPNMDLSISEQVAPLLRNQAQLGILLVMDSLDIDGLREALRAGVREVLPASTTPSDLGEAIGRLTRVITPLAPARGTAIPRNADGIPTRGKLVMVCSAKGGTGVTTLSLNLAAALAAAGRNVALCDADPVFGDISLNLGLKAPQPVDLGDLPKKLQPEEVAESLVLHKPSGVKVLDAFRTSFPLNDLPQELVMATLDGLQLAAEISVVDIPAPLVNAAEYLIHADELFFVATTDMASLKNLRIARQLMAEAGLPEGKAWLALNRIRNINDFEAATFEQIVGLPVVTALPDTPAVQHAADAATPLVTQYPRDGASRAVTKLASVLGSRFDQLRTGGTA